MKSPPDPSKSHSPQLSIALLGSPQIEQCGEPVEVDTRKAIAILAYVAVEEGIHSRDTLAALLWPESDERRARASLRRTLSPLRKAVADEHLLITRDTVELARKPGLWIDVEEFRKIARAHQDHNSETGFCASCATDLEQAAALYRDDFMSGFTLRDSAEFDDWQFYQSETMRREFAAVLEKLVLAEAARGEMDKAIQYARQRLSIDPLHEPAHRQLMRLYVWADRRSAALRQYQECARVLEDELGVMPLEETQELYAAIRENKEIPTTFALRSELQPESTHQPVPAAIISTRRYPLVGREREFGILKESYRLCAEGGRLVLIRGEAGVGKTRLAREFLQAVQARGARIVMGRAFLGEEDLAYAPLAGAIREALEHNPQVKNKIDPSWLAEASRLIPELNTGDSPISPAGNDSGARTRLYEAFTQVLLAFSEGLQPGVIFFDDLHWADESTVEFLAYLSRRLHARSRLLLLAWRSEESTQNPVLERMVTEAQRNQRGETLHLSRLTPGEVDALIADLPDEVYNTNADLGARLYRETEGLPFLLIEYLDGLASGGLAREKESWQLTPGGRDLLHARLSGIGETGLQLLQTAAVIGRECDFDLLREVSGRTEEEAIATLETLVERGILQETEREEGISLDFSHHKLRALVYDEISSIRRRLLHRRVAQTLVTLSRTRQKTPASIGLAAYHYRLGGLPEEAAECHVLAGDQAANLLAHTEAIAHYQSALAMGFPEPADLAEKIADEQVLLGSYQAAKINYQSAGAHFSEGSPASTRLAHKMGRLYQRMGNWSAAQAQFENAAGSLESDSAELSRLYADWSLTAHRSGQAQRAEELAETARRIAEDSGDRQALAQAHNLLGVLARGRGDLKPAIEHLETSLKLAEAEADTAARIAALNNLALALADQDALQDAVEHTQKALELCQEIGDRHRQAALHNNLADLHHAFGNSDAAMAELKHAVTIFSEIGTEAEEQIPTRSEIWKLSEW